MLWVPLQAVVMRAGSFDDVRPRLGRGDIMSRAAGFYTLGGAPRERADNRIPPRWWEWQRRDVDPAAGRASFNMELGDRIADELLQRARYPGLDFYHHLVDHVLVAIGIELERGAVEALWPGAITLVDASWPKVVAPVEALRSETSAPAPKHAGGRPPEHKWEVAARNVDRWVADHEPLPRDADGEPVLKRARELMAEGFENDDPPAPNDEDIYKWIREHPQRCKKWWSPRRRR